MVSIAPSWAKLGFVLLNNQVSCKANGLEHQAKIIGSCAHRYSQVRRNKIRVGPCPTKESRLKTCVRTRLRIAEAVKARVIVWDMVLFPVPIDTARSGVAATANMPKLSRQLKPRCVLMVFKILFPEEKKKISIARTGE